MLETDAGYENKHLCVPEHVKSYSLHHVPAALCTLQFQAYPGF